MLTIMLFLVLMLDARDDDPVILMHTVEVIFLLLLLDAGGNAVLVNDTERWEMVLDAVNDLFKD